MKDITVAEVMTTPVLMVADDWGVERLASFFVQNNVSGAPVTTASGDVVGVVSLTDIVRHSSLPVHQGEVRDTHEYYLANSGRRYSDEEMEGFRIESDSDATSRDLMTPMVFQVAEDTAIEEVAKMMVSGGIHRVLVTKHKKLTGIVTAVDILKAVLDGSD